MARCKLISPFAAYHGGVGDGAGRGGNVTYGLPGAGPVARRYAARREVVSIAQARQRGTVRVLAEHFAGLSSSDAASWAVGAASVRRRNALGVAYGLCGIGWHHAINQARIDQGAEVIDTWPDVEPEYRAAPVSVSVAALSPSAWRVTWVIGDAAPGGWCRVRFAGPLSSAARLARIGEYRYLAEPPSDWWVAVDGAGTYSLDVESGAGLPAEGERWGVEVQRFGANYEPGDARRLVNVAVPGLDWDLTSAVAATFHFEDYAFNSEVLDSVSGTALGEMQDGGGNPAYTIDYRTSGKVGYAFVLQAERVYLGVVPALDFGSSGAFSVAAWFWPESVGEGSSGRIIDYYGVTGYRLMMYSGNRLAWGTGNQVYTGVDSVTLSAWNFVVVSLGADRKVSIWLNGSLELDEVQCSIANPDATARCVIGNNDAQNRFFDGRLDEVRWFNRKLTATEAAGLWNGGAGTAADYGVLPS